MKNKLKINNISTSIYQIFNILIGLILPRLFLLAYGSEVNGLVSSITQMLGVISLLDLGVGAVVQSSLYSPLSKKDNESISIIYSATKKYFNIIAKCLLVYILLLFIYFGIVKDTGFTPIFSITLIISISISSFAQYYFGICNQLLLGADQKFYIISLVSLLTLILNAIVTFILININMSVQIVKLVASLIFIIKPVIYNIYVKKHYKIKLIKNPPKNSIKQKWSGLAQHLSAVVSNLTDYMILTIFSTLQVISVYNIYVMPLNSIRALFESISQSYKSFFGNIYVENKIENLKYEFRKYELIIHFFTVIIFTCVCKVLVPFVLLYTSGINDANYENYFFSYVITLAYAIYVLRIPYTTVIFSAGHFKQTQLYSIIEILLNVIISVICVGRFDMAGVAIGTCIGVGYRLIASVYYLHKEIIKRDIYFFVKTILVDLVSVSFILLTTLNLTITENSIINWILFAAINLMICSVITSIIYYFSYPKVVKTVIKQFKLRLNNTKKKVK